MNKFDYKVLRQTLNSKTKREQMKIASNEKSRKIQLAATKQRLQNNKLQTEYKKANQDLKEQQKITNKIHNNSSNINSKIKELEAYQSRFIEHLNNLNKNKGILNIKGKIKISDIKKYAEQFYNTVLLFIFNNKIDSNIRNKVETQFKTNITIYSHITKLGDLNDSLIKRN